MIYRIIYFLFKKRIDALVDAMLTDEIMDKYINDNFVLCNGLTSPEIQFKGKQMIKYMAGAVYEIVKDADNYVTMDLCAEGYEPMTVTIQKRWKLSPHKKAEKLEKENAQLKDEIDTLRKQMEPTP